MEKYKIFKHIELNILTIDYLEKEELDILMM